MTQQTHYDFEMAELRSDLEEVIEINRILHMLVYVGALFGAAAGFAVTLAAFRIGGVI